MPDIGTVSIGFEVRGKRDIASAIKSFDSMKRKMLDVAIAERQGVVAAGSLARATKQLQSAFARQTGDLISATKAAQAHKRELMAMDDAQLAAMAGAQGMGRSLNRTGVYMQQFGYQMGDLIVQVQSGTNFFVAFGQQATQMAGLLTMSANPAILGLGVALSIIIPLSTAAAAAFMRTRDAQDQAGNSAEDLKSKIEAVDEALQDYVNTARAAAQGVSLDEIFSVDELRRAEAELARLKILAEEIGSDVSFRGLGESFVGMLSGLSFGLLDFTVDKQVDTYEQLVVAAEERIARLRRMQAAERATEFVKRQQELQQEIALQEVILQYGEDSIEAERLRIQQALEGKVAEIREQQRLGDLTEIQAENLERSERAAAALALRIAEANAKPVFGPEIPEGFGDSDRPSGPSITSLDELIDRRQKQLDLELELLGLNRERATARRIEFELENQYQGEVTETMREQIQAAAESMAAQEEQIQKLEEIRDRNKEVADTIADSFGKAFTSIMDGTKSTSDAFKDMARQIIADLYQIYVVKQITGFISGAIDNFLGGFTDTQYTGGSMRANEPYLVGENGPELVIPRKSSTVVNADLTSKALGSGGGETIVVNQTINVSTGVQQTVRNEIQNLMPQISEAAKSAVVDAKRRGGSYGRAFG
jgi:hypothetical protein